MVARGEWRCPLGGLLAFLLFCHFFFFHQGCSQKGCSARPWILREIWFFKFVARQLKTLVLRRGATVVFKKDNYGSPPRLQYCKSCVYNFFLPLSFHFSITITFHFLEWSWEKHLVFRFWRTVLDNTVHEWGGFLTEAPSLLLILRKWEEKKLLPHPAHLCNLPTDIWSMVCSHVVDLYQAWLTITSLDYNHGWP